MTQASDAARGLTEAEILAGDPEANGVPATAAGESSWAPVDLGACEGTGQAAPTLLPRVDDRCLLYEGRIHELAAPPESGKGWIAQEARELLDRRLEDLDAAPAPPDRNQRLDESKPDEDAAEQGVQSEDKPGDSDGDQGDHSDQQGTGGTGSGHARSVFAERPAE